MSLRTCSQLVFLGSGSSAGIPIIRCILQRELGCKVCQDALSVDSKNRRGNPCLLLRHKNGSDILFDCGKTFASSVIQWFPKYSITKVDAVVLTHGHADAIMGLDNLREVQFAQLAPSDWQIKNSTPLYATQTTLNTVRTQLPWVLHDGGNVPTNIVTSVTNCHPVEIKEDKPFDVCGVELTPLPVLHGPGYTSLGFVFGCAPNQRVVYISDVSEVPEATFQVITEAPVDVLIVDTLMREHTRPSHFSLNQSLAFIRQIRPRKTYLIGMSCDIDHDTTNTSLASLAHTEQLNVELSYDGLCLDVNL